MSLVYVTAVSQAKKGREKDLAAELAKVVLLVRAEPGCIRYDLHQNAETGAFPFYEIWKNAEAPAVHAETEHIKAMQAAAADMSTGPSQVCKRGLVQPGRDSEGQWAGTAAVSAFSF